MTTHVWLRGRVEDEKSEWRIVAMGIWVNWAVRLVTRNPVVSWKENFEGSFSVEVSDDEFLCRIMDYLGIDILTYLCVKYAPAIKSERSILRDHQMVAPKSG